MSDLRDATREDLPAITAIYGHFVQHTTASFEIEPPDVAEMTRRWQAVVDKGLPYLVAVVEGEVAGYAYAAPYRPRPAYRFTLEHSIYIHPDQRGKGLGRFLMRRLIHLCEQLGYRQMLAVIGGSDNEASIRLHTHLGFTRVGVLPGVGYKFGRWVDSVLMQRALGV